MKTYRAILATMLGLMLIATVLHAQDDCYDCNKFLVFLHISRNIVNEKIYYVVVGATDGKEAREVGQDGEKMVICSVISKNSPELRLSDKIHWGKDSIKRFYVGVSDGELEKDQNQAFCIRPILRINRYIPKDKVECKCEVKLNDNDVCDATYEVDVENKIIDLYFEFKTK